MKELISNIESVASRLVATCSTVLMTGLVILAGATQPTEEPKEAVLVVADSLTSVQVSEASDEPFICTGVAADLMLPDVDQIMASLEDARDVKNQPSIAEIDAENHLDSLPEEVLADADQEIAESEAVLAADTSNIASTGISNTEYVAELIESEAGNVESKEGRVAVALTAFQRVEADEYPDTLVKVVEQPYQYADLVGRYSEESYAAAEKAIALWVDGTDEAVLPEGFMYFFGYNKQNWFYRLADDGTVEFYALPGQTITEDVWQAYLTIVGKGNNYAVIV